MSCTHTVLAITKSFALCGAMEEAMEYANEVAFHQAIRAPLIKTDKKGGRGDFKDTDFELKQLVSELIADRIENIGIRKGMIDLPDETDPVKDFNDVGHIP